MSTLRPDQREAVALRYEEGLSFDEIGQVCAFRRLLPEPCHGHAKNSHACWPQPMGSEAGLQRMVVSCVILIERWTRIGPSVLAMAGCSNTDRDYEADAASVCDEALIPSGGLARVHRTNDDAIANAMVVDARPPAGLAKPLSGAGPRHIIALFRCASALSIIDGVRRGARSHDYATVGSTGPNLSLVGAHVSAAHRRRSLRTKVTVTYSDSGDCDRGFIALAPA